jgi:hypothetical protein
MKESSSQPKFTTESTHHSVAYEEAQLHTPFQPFRLMFLNLAFSAFYLDSKISFL